MLGKTRDALIIGFVIWLAGMLLIALFGSTAYFPLAVVPGALLTAPFMYWVTRLYLRDVPLAEQASIAVQFGIIVTAVQCPLDALGWLAILKMGYPSLSQVARDALIIGLEIGYFWLLVIPYWVAKRR